MKTIVIRPNKSFAIDLKELWFYRELFYFLAWRDIKVRYKQTAIGIIWAIMQPLMTVLVFTLFFSKSLSQTIGNIPYPVFSYIGLLYWNYFSMALSAISISFFANKTIITKVFFPRIIIPISAATVPVVDFFFAFFLLFPLLLFFHMLPSLEAVVVLLLCLILSFIVCISLGLSLAIVNVKYRDIQYAIPFFIQLLLFVTPVIYPVTVLPKQYQIFLYLNPMTFIIQLAQDVIFNTDTISLPGAVISLCVTCLFFFLSIWVYKRYEAFIADIV